jgi:uncharacterized protein (TIGR00299 family) protein
MRVIYFDCFSGISGDMVLGALLNLGFPEGVLKAELDKLPLPEFQIKKETVSRAHIAGVKVTLEPEGGAVFRRPSDMKKAIEKSGLKPKVKEKALAVLSRLVSAEAEVHQEDDEHIHFHELGNIDTIVDIVGAAVGFDYLGIEEFTSSAVNVGSGFVSTAHGRMPVPAPAVSALLSGVPIFSAGEGELTTPTGAAVLTAHAKRFEPLPRMRLMKVGYGAGSREVSDLPNLLRLFLGEREEMDAAFEETVVIEANIDDMNPQLSGWIIERLLAASALDVYLQPVVMKKGRSGVLLSVLSPKDEVEELSRIIFEETTTIGLRTFPVLRRKLIREEIPVVTPYGEVRMKISRLSGKPVNILPEYEDCRKIAREKKVPLKVVQQAAIKAFLDTLS